MNLFQGLLECIVGRLVLKLPKEDLEQINEMLKKAFGEMKNETTL